MTELALFFDSETTGLVNARAPAADPSQPHLVQLAALLVDPATGRELATVGLVVRPDGWEVPAGAAAVHGITTELARAVGVPLVVALAVFSNLVKLTQYHVAHNADFDVRVMTAAFHRAGKIDSMPPLNPRCTQALSTPLLNLPPSERMLRAGFDKPKPPKLSECYKFFFDEDLAGAHDALVDARACARVYLELQKRGVAPDEPVA